MNDTVIWVILGGLVGLYVITEFFGKGRYNDVRGAFILNSLNKRKGKVFVDKYLAANEVEIEIIETDGAFTDRFIYMKNRLELSATGVGSDVVAAINAALRETARAVMFNKNKALYYGCYLVQDILKTLTLIAVPGLFVALAIKSDLLLILCAGSYYALAIYNLLISDIEKKISYDTNQFVKENKVFTSDGQILFEKLNEIANTALFFTTFNSFRQFTVLLQSLFARKPKEK